MHTGINIMHRNPLQVVNQVGHPLPVSHGLLSLIVGDKENDYYFIPGNRGNGQHAVAYHAKKLSLDGDCNCAIKKKCIQRKSTSDLASNDIVTKDPITANGIQAARVMRLKEDCNIGDNRPNIFKNSSLGIASNVGFQTFRIVKPKGPGMVLVQAPNIPKNKSVGVLGPKVVGLLQKGAPDPVQKQEARKLNSDSRNSAPKTRRHHNSEYLGLEYRQSYLNHLLQTERTFKLTAEFPRPNVSSGQRTIVVDWLTQVHDYFRLDPAGLYLAVRLMDSFVDKSPVLQYCQLQLIGITALWIAAKYLDSNAIPDIQKLRQLCKNKYSKVQIRTMEVALLRSCKFNMNLGDPMQFVHYYVDSINSPRRELMVHICNYLMDLLLLDSKFAGALPSLVASAAILTTLQVLKVPNKGKHLLYSAEQNRQLSQAMWRYLVAAGTGRMVQKNAFNKFKSHRYRGTSLLMGTFVKQAAFVAEM